MKDGILSIPGKVIGSIACGFAGIVLGAISGLIMGIRFPWEKARDSDE